MKSVLLKGLFWNKESRYLGMDHFKHPPTEARWQAKPCQTSQSFCRRQQQSGFGGWADEKIKLARAAVPLVPSWKQECVTIREIPFNVRYSHTQHLTITHQSPFFSSYAGGLFLFSC